MKSPLRFRAAGLTDRGLRRPRNEDAFLCDETRGLFAVADGLGGLPKGEVAAVTAITAIAAETVDDSVPDWQDIFSRVNRAVVGAGFRAGVPSGIGTTLTAVHIVKDTFCVGHVGDSGLFVFSSPTHATKVTDDHTLAQEILDSRSPGTPETIPEHYYHTLTRCIGQHAVPEVQTLEIRPDPGSRHLLYTDGVTKTMDLAELGPIVFAAESPEALVRRIVEIANARGGPDNVTAVAIFC